MELRHLRYFVAVAEELHFGRAARRLHIAQPALSQQIQKLERELGVSLLARTKRRVALTEPGRAFLEEARRTLRNAERAIAAARRAADGETGRLRVGYVDWAIELFLPAILRRYRERYPAVDLSIDEMHREPQRDALLRGDLDLGLFGVHGDERELSAELLAADPLVAILPDTHPAAAERSVPLEALRADPWIVPLRALRTRFLQVVLEACAAAGFVPRVVHEATHMSAFPALVSAGIGVGLMPRAAARRPREHVAVLPLSGPAPVLPHHAVWAGDTLSPTAARFLAVARELRDAGGVDP